MYREKKKKKRYDKKKMLIKDMFATYWEAI